jgi:hypothetical protein
MTGIRTIEDIRQRCAIDEAGCWVWRRATTTSGGRPAAYLPAIGRAGTISHALKLIGGKTSSRSYYPAKCMNRLCCNPAHQALMTKSQMTRITTPSPTPLTRARMARGRAAVAPLRLTPCQYREIRGSDMCLNEIIQKYGVSRSYASILRSGKASVFRSLDLQHVAAGSSVFSFLGQ